MNNVVLKKAIQVALLNVGVTTLMGMGTVDAAEENFIPGKGHTSELLTINQTLSIEEQHKELLKCFDRGKELCHQKKFEEAFAQYVSAEKWIIRALDNKFPPAREAWRTLETLYGEVATAKRKEREALSSVFQEGMSYIQGKVDGYDKNSLKAWTQAAPCFKPLAEAGDPDAEYYYGRSFLIQGKALHQQKQFKEAYSLYMQAKTWFDKLNMSTTELYKESAKTIDRLCETLINDCYQEGLNYRDGKIGGHAKNSVEAWIAACGYFEFVASLGHGGAQYNCAKSYYMSGKALYDQGIFEQAGQCYLEANKWFNKPEAQKLPATLKSLELLNGACQELLAKNERHKRLKPLQEELARRTKEVDDLNARVVFAQAEETEAVEVFLEADRLRAEAIEEAEKIRYEYEERKEADYQARLVESNLVYDIEEGKKKENWNKTLRDAYSSREKEIEEKITYLKKSWEEWDAKEKLVLEKAEKETIPVSQNLQKAADKHQEKNSEGVASSREEEKKMSPQEQEEVEKEISSLRKRIEKTYENFSNEDQTLHILSLMKDVKRISERKGLDEEKIRYLSAMMKDLEHGKRLCILLAEQREEAAKRNNEQARTQECTQKLKKRLEARQANKQNVPETKEQQKAKIVAQKALRIVKEKEHRALQAVAKAEIRTAEALAIIAKANKEKKKSQYLLSIAKKNAKKKQAELQNLIKKEKALSEFLLECKKAEEKAHQVLKELEEKKQPAPSPQPKLSVPLVAIPTSVMSQQYEQKFPILEPKLTPVLKPVLGPIFGPKLTPAQRYQRKASRAVLTTPTEQTNIPQPRVIAAQKPKGVLQASKIISNKSATNEKVLGRPIPQKEVVLTRTQLRDSQPSPQTKTDNLGVFQARASQVSATLLAKPAASKPPAAPAPREETKTISFSQPVEQPAAKILSRPVETPTSSVQQPQTMTLAESIRPWTEAEKSEISTLQQVPIYGGSIPMVFDEKGKNYLVQPAFLGDNPFGFKAMLSHFPLYANSSEDICMAGTVLLKEFAHSKVKDTKRRQIGCELLAADSERVLLQNEDRFYERLCASGEVTKEMLLNQVSMDDFEWKKAKRILLLFINKFIADPQDDFSHGEKIWSGIMKALALALNANLEIYQKQNNMPKVPMVELVDMYQSDPTALTIRLLYHNNRFNVLTVADSAYAFTGIVRS